MAKEILIPSTIVELTPINWFLRTQNDGFWPKYLISC
jgi:hypothetical protein